MAKKEKVVNLAPKAKKITDEELKALQELAKSFENHYRELGVMSVRKHALNHAVQMLQGDMNEMQGKLKEQYGNVDIDIVTGDIKENDETDS
tara:strand:- start:58 stop:333 length:276 start_codon:yes stop_codon:yes gene_type:complete